MRYRILTMAAGALAVAACGGPDTASGPDFESVAQAWHDEHPVCIVLTAAFPHELRVPGREALHRRYDALVAAGLLTAEPFDKPETDIRGGERPVAHVRYRATDAGAQAMRPPDAAGNTDLCFARRRVAAITDTAPPTEALGVRSVRIAYDWTLEDVAPWAESAAVQAEWPGIARALEPRSGANAALMVETDTGWRYGPVDR